MGLRRLPFHLVCALLGAAVAVMPAVAGSETSPTIEAGFNGYYPAWVPPQRTVAPGGSVAFSNPTTLAHGIEWRSEVKPSCSSGVPVGTTPEASGTKWSGTCTFSQPGSYTFWCTVHRSAMAGTVTVSSSGETTTTTTTMPSGTTTTTTTATQPGGTTSSPPAAGIPAATPPQAGLATVISLAGRQRGKAVRGSVEVATADAGGRLEVDLLASRAALASAGAASARVGRLVHSSLHAGKLSFSVPLNAKGRRALARHRRLALTVKILLAPAQGPPSSASRRIVLHP
ncbi:MAG TPA: plastocyanin/azurin family copper-binding protein [Solirubrobacteraceae bacterium]|jgi:plastocyanin|nr:plastocyanin/azurin family copper-binding protein [Solirubrobacteraceae bacterium]